MSASNGGSRRAVVLEKDPAMCVLIQQILALDGFEVETDQRAAAPAGLLQNPPDLLILGLGTEEPQEQPLYRLLQKDPGTASIPIVFCTSQRATTLRRRLGALPPILLYKPFRAQELRDAVSEALSRRA